MENNTIHNEAVAWFTSKFQTESGEIFVSKFLTSQESSSKSSVWYFQLPLALIYSNISKKIHLLCENHLRGDSFIYLRVSTLFFLKNLNSFDIDQKRRVLRIYLSAEAVTIFTEIKGKGKIDFTPFVITD